MHVSSPEMGGGGGGGREGGWRRFALSFMEFVVVNAHGVVSVRVTRNLDAKTDELSTIRMVQGRQGFIQVKNNTF